ncbi:MAG: zinc ribbon domain-containing protein [Acidobacteriota bacterium]|nr:zinc ribbon domain-containing protein [Acidobacteriota bacterium]
MKDVEPVLVEGRIRIPYRWPAGRVAGRFLEVLRAEGRFEGLRCPRCKKVTVPPRPRCLVCGVVSDDRVTVGPEGTVTTWTRRPQGVLALVQLDGADTAILHCLFDVERPESGMRVIPVLRDGLQGFRSVDEP